MTRPLLLRASRRRAFTLVEMLIAGTLALGVVATATTAYLGLQRQGASVTAHATGMRSVTMARARLQADLAAMVPLEDSASEPGGVTISPDGSRVRMRCFRPDADLDRAPGGPTHLVTWEAQDTPEGGKVLVRQTANHVGSMQQDFPGIPLVALRFRLLEHASRRFLQAELEVGRAGIAGTIVRISRALPRASRVPGWVIGPTPPAVLAAVPDPTGTLPTIVFPPVAVLPL